MPFPIGSLAPFCISCLCIFLFIHTHTQKIFGFAEKDLVKKKEFGQNIKMLKTGQKNNKIHVIFLEEVCASPLFVRSHACFQRHLCACLSCETSLATLCRGHANWTAIRHEGRFMLLCSPLTGAVLLFYVSWWGWGQGLITGVAFITAAYCGIGPDVCPH